MNTMKKAILSAVVASFALAINVKAQSSSPVSASAPSGSVQDEVRVVSGELKEAYAAVYQQLNLLNKEVAAVSGAQSPEQAARQERLNTALLQLEGMLSTVNSVNEESWSEVKAKAQIVRTSAMELIPAKKE